MYLVHHQLDVVGMPVAENFCLVVE